MSDTFALLARYNQWMNQRLYAAAQGLPDALLSAERGAFFGSILGTLNHLVAGDITWLQRFATHPAGFAALEPIRQLPRPENLSALLFADIGGLWERRQMIDAVVVEWVATLTAEDLQQPLRYRNTRGIESNKRFESLLVHFFNHQTHHRGQATTLLHQAGVDVGVTDLLALIDNQP